MTVLSDVFSEIGNQKSKIKNPRIASPSVRSSADQFPSRHNYNPLHFCPRHKPDKTLYNSPGKSPVPEQQATTAHVLFRLRQ